MPRIIVAHAISIHFTRGSLHRHLFIFIASDFYFLCVSDAFDTLVKYLFMALYVIIHPKARLLSMLEGATQKKKYRIHAHLLLTPKA